MMGSTEGGRLEQELDYTQKSLGEMESTTHQLVIQTPKDPDASILHSQALLTHLEVLQQATAVNVQMFEITWSLRDMCNVPTIPQFDAHFIEQIFENIIPCSIVTPLDCFWEGSKLLGPEYPVRIPYVVQWFYAIFTLFRFVWLPFSVNVALIWHFFFPFSLSRGK